MAFAERGAIVAANDISPINVELVVAEIEACGGKAKAYIEDVAKKVGVQALINSMEDDFGGIDIWSITRRWNRTPPCWTWMNGTGIAHWM